MTHQLPSLPYPQDALAPHMSSETRSLHHGKHHATYFWKLVNWHFAAANLNRETPFVP